MSMKLTIYLQKMELPILSVASAVRYALCITLSHGPLRVIIDRMSLTCALRRVRPSDTWCLHSVTFQQDMSTPGMWWLILIWSTGESVRPLIIVSGVRGPLSKVSGAQSLVHRQIFISDNRLSGQKHLIWHSGKINQQCINFSLHSDIPSWGHQESGHCKLLTTSCAMAYSRCPVLVQ